MTADFRGQIKLWRQGLVCRPPRLDYITLKVPVITGASIIHKWKKHHQDTSCNCRPAILSSQGRKALVMPFFKLWLMWWSTWMIVGQETWNNSQYILNTWDSAQFGFKIEEVSLMRCEISSLKEKLKEVQVCQTFIIIKNCNKQRLCIFMPVLYF